MRILCNISFILLVIMGLSACNNTQQTEKDSATSADTTAAQPSEAPASDETQSAASQAPEVIIEDNTAYSKRFIDGLKSFEGFQKFVLKDSLLIINDQETAVFPAKPEIGRQIVLTGQKDAIRIALTVKRVNYTTINYKVEIAETGKKSLVQSGEADISSSFFLGAESDESDSGQSYFVTEFSDQQSDECYAYIRLGYDDETPDARLLGKLIKTCNGNIRNIALDDFPALKEK